jgi:hypothetical protein
VVLKLERPRHAQLNLFVLLFVLISLGASLRRHMDPAALFVIAPGHEVLRLAQLERRRLRLLSTLIPHIVDLGRCTSNNLGLLDSIRK